MGYHRFFRGYQLNAIWQLQIAGVLVAAEIKIAHIKRNELRNRASKASDFDFV